MSEQLRNAENHIFLRGILKEKNLRTGTGKNGEYISGDIVLSTGGNSEHRVAVFSSKVTSKGVESNAYKSLNSVMNGVSVAELVKMGKSIEEATAMADRISIRDAQLELNDYYGRDGNLVSLPRIRTSFVTRIPAESANNFALSAPTFDIEGYMQSMRPEMDTNGEETGRYFITLIVPNFRGQAMPMEFVTTKEAGGYISSHYELNKTCHVYGKIVNDVIETVTVKTGFLGNVEERATTRVHEMLIENGEPGQYDEEDVKAFKREDIQAAMVYRESEYLPAIKENQQRRQAEKAVSSSVPNFTPPQKPASGFAFDY